MSTLATIYQLVWVELTVSEIPEIGELIAPLRDDPESIFEKCDDDEKPSYGWKISNSIAPRVSLLKFPTGQSVLDS
jgi:hypothetical protein